MSAHEHGVPQDVPNHHAGFGRFSGLGGYVFALRFLVRRGADARLACKLAALTSDDVVVDIGSGPGVAARAAAKTARRVIAVDPASPMLRVGRLFGTKRVEYRRGTAEALPVEAASCSVAWSLATAHHWADVDAALSEVRRVLVPGGRLLVIERQVVEGASGRGSHGWTEARADAFYARAVAAGFTDVAWSAQHSRPTRVVIALTARA